MKEFARRFDLDTIPGISQLIHLDKTESTMNVARELAVSGVSENTLIIADVQTAGRGQLGRSWEAGEGGLYMTVMLRPQTALRFLSDVSRLTADIVAGTLSDMYGVKTRVKLPNDVYAYHPARGKWLKICGILTESASSSEKSDWMIIGIGVNLNNKLYLDTAVSVKNILKKNVSIPEFLDGFFGNFWSRYSCWEYASRLKS